MSATERDDDDRDDEQTVASAVSRLREIARVLGRPLADFFDPPGAEPSPQSDNGPTSSGSGEG